MKQSRIGVKVAVMLLCSGCMQSQTRLEFRQLLPPTTAVMAEVEPTPPSLALPLLSSAFGPPIVSVPEPPVNLPPARSEIAPITLALPTVNNPGTAVDPFPGDPNQVGSVRVIPSTYTFAEKNESTGFHAFIKDTQGRDVDPKKVKLKWAVSHPQWYEVNQAGVVKLLDVSGFSFVTVTDEKSGQSDQARVTFGRGGAGGAVEPLPTTNKFLPNGRLFLNKIIFESRRNTPTHDNIYIMDPDGTNIQQLTDGAFFNDTCSWSPNGQKIAFRSNRDGNFEVYVMNADGTNQQRITTDPAEDGAPSWSPDGTKLVFHTIRDGNFEVYVMNADGTNQQRITNSPGLDGDPIWSPDGKFIVFLSVRDGNSEVYVMKPDGSEPQRLTNNTASDAFVSVSPDSSKLVFSSNRDGNNEIYTMAINGSNQTRLTHNLAADADAFWSPDGSKIVFRSNRDGGADEIYIMNADGTNQQRITNHAARDAYPYWQ